MDSLYGKEQKTVLPIRRCSVGGVDLYEDEGDIYAYFIWRLDDSLGSLYYKCGSTTEQNDTRISPERGVMLILTPTRTDADSDSPNPLKFLFLTMKIKCWGVKGVAADGSGKVVVKITNLQEGTTKGQNNTTGGRCRWQSGE